jgi:hypothetical protein
MSKKSDILRRVVDGTFVGGGHQVVKARRQERKTPEWANNDGKIREFVTRAFPKLFTSARQQEGARRWVRVVYLYFRMGYTETQTAEEMGLTLSQAKGIIISLRRAAKGLWAKGTGKHGVRRVGRPTVKNGTPRL